MKPFTLSFLIVSATAGLVLGWQLKTRGESENATSPEESVAEPSRRAAAEPADGGSDTPTSRRSSDTAMALHALPAEDLYDRMALFLLEAEAGDFPAFYEEFKKRSDRNTDLNDLLFIAWTRVDPEAAIAASRGTDDFRYAYWAWACHDPDAALASAKERNEGVGNAAWGIGEFHPEWLKENWELIPEDQRGNALQGLVKWPDTETPEISVRLILESKSGAYYSGTNEQTLLALARQDPIHAYELIKELTGGSSDYQNRGTLDSLINTLSRYEPALLGDIAAVTKSPVDKNKIQLAQFKGLLREDPDSAKAMIEGTPKSWLKDDLGITYASHLLAADPERGFDYAVDFLKNDFGSSDRYKWIKTEGGQSGSGNSDTGSAQLISSLLDQAAPALLNGLLPDSDAVRSSDPFQRGDAFQKASSAWAAQDVGAYAEWLGEHQDNPVVYRNGATSIANILQSKGEFEAGMEWVESIPVVEGQSNSEARQIYHLWLDSDPEGAVAWRLSDNFTGNPDQFPLPETTQAE